MLIPGGAAGEGREALTQEQEHFNLAGPRAGGAGVQHMLQAYTSLVGRAGSAHTAFPCSFSKPRGLMCPSPRADPGTFPSCRGESTALAFVPSIPLGSPFDTMLGGHRVRILPLCRRTDTTAPFCLKQCPRVDCPATGPRGKGQGRRSPEVPRVSVVPKQAGWGPAVLCPVPSRRRRCAHSHSCCSFT